MVHGILSVALSSVGNEEAGVTDTPDYILLANHHSSEWT